MSEIHTLDDLYKNLVLFVLNDVDEGTNETAVMLYDRWREHSRMTITDPRLAAFVLEYFENQKHCRREAMHNAAVIDGFL